MYWQAVGRAFGIAIPRKFQASWHSYNTHELTKDIVTLSKSSQQSVSIPTGSTVGDIGSHEENSLKRFNNYFLAENFKKFYHWMMKMIILVWLIHNTK